jgi:hypothetical protein
MIKKFMDLPTGAKFSKQEDNQTIYVKINEERISCCKVLNAVNSNNNEKIQRSN